MSPAKLHFGTGEEDEALWDIAPGSANHSLKLQDSPWLVTAEFWRYGLKEEYACVDAR